MLHNQVLVHLAMQFQRRIFKCENKCKEMKDDIPQVMTKAQEDFPFGQVSQEKTDKARQIF